ALYIRRGTKISPLFHGGYQEKSLRAGTENVPGIVGLGKTSEFAMQNMDSQGQSLYSLRSRLEKTLQEKVPDIRINGHPKQRLPHILNIAFQYIEGESLLLNLDMRGIYVSTGSACASGSLEPSHVVLALGVPPEMARGSIRFSLGKDNTSEDIDYTVGVIEEIVKRLRAMSPLYRDREKK
ncbi:MAG: aminotransferase class V-fold PLP-dependent enzyme, partial [bacterium]|nr:aminotransferase class V-fold PLP-dependent enzyme [bacterium]